MMKKCCKGNIIYTSQKDKFETSKNSYIVYSDGAIDGIYEQLPEDIKNIPVEDFGDKLIIPSFVDLHLHAPQWLNMGIGYSEQLLPWLNKYTFPLETRFESLDFAKKYYGLFIDELISSGTTRASIFATRHYEATRLLINMLKETGIGAFVGKVNMDRNSSCSLQENTDDSINETISLIEEFHGNNDNLVKYILTPRFVPSTTEALMTELGKITEKYGLPLQSHLDENRDEIKWVKELHPDIPSFTEVYEHFGLLPDNRTIMAHCVHNTDRELEVLKKHNTFIAHCPNSNLNISSGCMPIRKYLDMGLKIGLGSDISGGHSLYMPDTCVAAINTSKVLYTMDSSYKPLSFSEGFYLLTRGGGEFFGRVGSFEKGFEFDALVIDDSDLHCFENAGLEERLEKFIYTGSKNNIVKTYCHGEEV